MLDEDRRDRATEAPPRVESQAAEAASGPTDSARVEAARRGDRRAFTVLYERYRGAVHAVMLARIPARDAGDLVQDVFLTALERLPSLRDSNAFGGWLLAIARNRATDYLRRARPTSELPAELPDHASAAGPPRAELARAMDAIRSLPEAYRETLIMRLVEGMTGPEIAARTGLEPGSVRVNLHRGMKLLRARLEVGQ